MNVTETYLSAPQTARPMVGLMLVVFGYWGLYPWSRARGAWIWPLISI